MPLYQRGGRNIGALRVGRWQCLRQLFMHPGEVIDPVVAGWIEMEPLRDKAYLPLHLTMATFWTPMSYVYRGNASASDKNMEAWPDLVKKFPNITETKVIRYQRSNADGVMGLGFNPSAPAQSSSVRGGVWEPFFRNFNRIRNWWMRNPRDTEIGDMDFLPDAESCAYGPVATALPNQFSEALKWADRLTTAEKTVGISSGKLALPDLAVAQRKLRMYEDREWLAHDRYIELLRTMFPGSNASEHIEQRPYLVDLEKEWMAGMTIRASDGSQLGQQGGVMNFQIDHRPGAFGADDYGIYSIWFVLRWPPIWRYMRDPMSHSAGTSLQTLIGDPDFVATQEPERRHYASEYGIQSVVNGQDMAPYGDDWRHGYDVIHDKLYTKGTIPHFGNLANDNRYARHLATDNFNPFSVQQYGDGQFSIYCALPSQSRIPAPMTSVMAGAS